MGADLRERESGDTERGTAPAPATRGAGTEPPRIRSFRRPRSAGARHGGARGNDRNGGPTGENRVGEHNGGAREGAGSRWPAGDAATPDRRFRMRSAAADAPLEQPGQRRMDV